MDLAGHNFAFQSNVIRMDYRIDPSYGGFMLSWYVGTPDTSHWYSPKTGWGYYPD